MGRQGQLTVEDRYSARAHYKRLVSIYDSIL
jgi:hypothetical protein